MKVKAQAEAKVFSDAGNRAGAFLVDVVLFAFVAAALPDLGPAKVAAVLVLAVLYLALFAASPLQGTPGKWLARIRICDRAGGRLGWRASFLRAGAMLAWCALFVVLNPAEVLGRWGDAAVFAAVLLFTLPWAFMAFTSRRESLFDLVAGSLVVLRKADAATVAQAQPVDKHRVLNVAGTLFLCAVFAAFVALPLGALREFNMRARIAYALGETVPLRRQVTDFHADKGRWPTAAELGVATWTAYPAGGGYGLQPDGSIVIRFAVRPELKGGSLTLRRKSEAGQSDWQCSAEGIERRYLPSSCR